MPIRGFVVVKWEQMPIRDSRQDRVETQMTLIPEQQGQPKFKAGSKAALFLELAKPNANGFSRRVYVTEFQGEHDKLRFGNGGDWCRSDGSLAKYYNIERHQAKGKIDYVRLHGFNKNPIEKPIPKAVRDELVDKRCAILDVGNVQIDHKDGRRDDPRLNDSSKVTIEDFQPLSQAANVAKRAHCFECRVTGRRYDATRLGYAVSQFEGDGVYRGSCIGCYWHDPFAFNRAVSQSPG